MALPSSGQLTLAQIRDEFGAGTTSNVSLRTLASNANLSVPDGFNEFYGLSNNPAAAHFQVATFTGNGTTTSVNLPFTPRYSRISELNESSSNPHWEFTQDYAYPASNLNFTMAQVQSSVGTNVFNVGRETTYGNTINTSGVANYGFFFNLPNSITNPYSGNALPSNVKYYWNADIGVGMAEWQGQLTGSNYMYFGYGLPINFTSGNTIDFFWGNSYGRPSGAFAGSTSSEIAYSAASGRTHDWFGDPYDYSHANLPAVMNPEYDAGIGNFIYRRFLYYNYNDTYEQYYYNVYKGEAVEYSYIFYVTEIPDVSKVGTVSAVASGTTITTGWRPRMVMLWADGFAGRITFHTEGMPSGTSVPMWSTPYSFWLDDYGVTLSDTGFTLTNANILFKYYAIR